MGKDANKVSVAICSIVRRLDKRYRVIAASNSDVILCELDIMSLKLSSIPLSVFFGMIRDGSFVVEEEEEDDIAFTEEELAPKIRADYIRNREVIKEVEAAYGPYYLGLCGHHHKSDVERIIEAYGISRNKFWRIVTPYFQSGMKQSSLVDGRAFSKNTVERYNYTKKPGRKPEYFDSLGVVPTGEHLAHMMDALEKFKSRDCLSIMDAFKYMNNKYYRKPMAVGNEILYELLPESQRPTYKQLYDLINSHFTKKEILEFKTSAREVRNNNRARLGSSDRDARGPADIVEIDACEADVSLVSVEDKDKCVSRPTVYFMVDVYTRAIIAVSIDYQENSNRGIANLFLNLFDDKQEFAAKYGISFSPELWPSNIIPRRARLDHGSEMQSQYFEDACNKLGIEMNNVPPGMGSLKGIVEQEFRQLEMELSPHLKGYGLIEKRYGSEHHKESTLDIESYRELVIRFVLKRNQYHLKYYRRTKDMREKGVKPTPVSLWQYGVEKFGPPRPIVDRDHFVFSLLAPIEAKINDEGITYKGKAYLPVNDPDTMLRIKNAGRHKTPFPARWDDRDIGTVYYERDHKHYAAVLNDGITGNADETGLPEAEWDAARKADGKVNAEGRTQNEILDAFNYAENAATVAAAKKDTYSNTKDILEARAAEKELLASDNKIADRFADLPKLPKKAKKTKPEPKHYDSLDDALDELED